jgi:hypothetical protein
LDAFYAAGFPQSDIRAPKTCMNDKEAKGILNSMGAYMIYSTQRFDENNFGNSIKNSAQQYFMTGNIDIT